MRRHGHSQWAGLVAAALALGAWAGGAEAAESSNPVQAQVLRKTRLDAEALAAIRERTRALVQALQEDAATQERSVEGTVQAIRGDTLYVRTAPDGEPVVVPLEVRPSTRLIGHGARKSPVRRPAPSPAQALRLQLEEGAPVRARFTVSAQAGETRNVATSVQALPEPPPEPPPPAPPPAQR